MAVTVKVPPQLRTATGGDGALAVDGATVGEVLDALYGRHAELRDRVADEDGTLRRFVNVFLDGEDIRFLDGLATPVEDGAELTILPAVAGGSPGAPGPPARQLGSSPCTSGSCMGTTPRRSAG